jgi:DNA-binding winged helix-turn-helix (wHTH) protein
VIFRFDEFELDPDKPELRRAGRPLKVDALVVRLLAVLVRDAGRLVTKHALLTRVWEDRSVSENVITVAMARLRRALGQSTHARSLIATVHGQGYRFVGAVSAHPDELAPVVAVATALHEPPLVGREHALERLHAALAAARGGQGSMCFLTGEAGIGKTRVGEALAQVARAQSVAVAWGHCHDAGETPPLWPFAQIVRELVTQTSLSLQDARFASVRSELARLLPELAPEHAELDAGAPFAASGQHRIFDALLRVIAAAAEQTPCMLVLDDVQRADAGSLALLRYWIAEIARSRVLLLATLRPDGLHGAIKAKLAPVLGHRNSARLALERLSEADVAAYVAALLPDPDAALGRAVFAKSAGNPFFMVELARQLQASERPDAGALAVPDAALELLRQRVAALDAATRGMLSAAALIGRSFELPVLSAVTERDAASLMESLDDALVSEVVVAAADSKTAFAFGHELFRAALYDALPPAERRRAHARVARALDDRARAGETIARADVAYHAYAALPDGDLQLAVRACSRAADECAAVYAYPEAARHLRHAREALALIERPSQRLRIDLALRQALYARVGAPRDFEPLIREVVELARAQHAGTQLALAGLMLDLHPGFPPLSGARAVLQDALAWLAPEDPLRSAVLARLATAAPLAFDARASADQIARALAVALEHDFLLGIYTARSAQLFLLGGPAHAAVASELLGALETLCQAYPAVLNVAPLLLDLHRAIVAGQHGDRAAIDAALERCEARGTRVGSRELLWHVERFRVLSRTDAGLSAEDLAALRALHARAAEDALAGARLLCAYDQCVVLGVTDAAARAEAAAALAFSADDPPNLWALKLRALAAIGVHEDVRVGLRAVSPERLALLPCDRDFLGTLGALAHAALATSAFEYAAPLRALLAPYAERFAVNVSFVSDGSVAELIAALDRTTHEVTRNR